jgi:hypothetical protein
MPQVALAQAKPVDGDSSAYTQAYELLFDSQARAIKAVGLLLPEGRVVTDLNAKELSLLCRAYNELGDYKKQLTTAQELWSREPGSNSATSWMINSLHNTYAFSDDTKPLMEFVDDALLKNQGNKHSLLVLKATAILATRKGMTDAEKRVTVSDLLVEAYKSGPALSPYNEQELATPDSPEFIDMDFGTFFSTPEREALKLRMIQARKQAEKERTK